MAKGLVQRGDKWGYDFVHRGQRHTATIGAKQAALDALAALRGKLLDARLSQDYGIVRRGRNGQSVEQFFRGEYTTWQAANRSATTCKGDAWVLARFCSTYGARALDRITETDIESYKASRTAVKKSTLCYDLVRLSAFFKHAVETGHIARNPVDRVEKPKPEQRIYRLLEPAEEQCFFEAIKNPTARALFRVTFLTGLRRSEALGLRVGQVRLDRQEIALVQPKTGEAKTLFLLPEAVEILKNTIPADAKPDAFVFQSHGHPIGRTSWNNHFRRARKHCTLTGFRPHDLRHTIGTRLADAGAPLAVIGQALGHRPPYRSTLTYVQHAKRADVRAALARVFAGTAGHVA